MVFKIHLHFISMGKPIVVITKKQVVFMHYSLFFLAV
jgi:hypothetical protein